MLQTGGGKVKVHVLGVEKAARVYKNPSTRPSRRSSSSRPRPTSCACSTWGVEAKEVNVGGMTFKQGTSQVSQAV